MVFKHSALNLPLKFSMKVLLVGFPGREKSRMHFSGNIISLAYDVAVLNVGVNLP